MGEGDLEEEGQPDENEDDVPDSAPVVMLDGFTVAQSNYHNFANGLRWGPDGWLYGRCGHSCPGRVGAPGTPDEERVPIEGGIWRFHPERKVFEVLTHGTTNPWGHDWDRNGELFFINTVNGHLWHGISGAHFTESFGADPNPYAYERIDTQDDVKSGFTRDREEDRILNVVGIQFKPHPQVVLKLDYRNIASKGSGQKADEVEFGFGYVF